MSVHWGGRGFGHVSRNSSLTQPGLRFDFTGGTLDSRITFTRASSGSYINNSNVVSTALTDVARFDYLSGTSCLLIEPARTNLVVRSGDLTNASWAVTRATKTTGQSDPAGGTGAGLITANGAAGSHFVSSPQVSTASGTTYAFSLFLKPSIGTLAQLTYDNTNFPAAAYANLTLSGAGTATTGASATAAIAAFGLWYIASAIIAATGNATNGVLAAFIASTANTYVPSNSSTDAWTVWGAQIEAGATATSYIATTAASASRAADSASFTIPNGVANLKYTFDDDSTQTVAVSAGSYTIPTNLSRPRIKTIVDA